MQFSPDNLPGPGRSGPSPRANPGLLLRKPFDRLSSLTANVLRADISLITLRDGGSELVKSVHGLPESWMAERDLPLSACLQERAGEPLLVADAAEHPLMPEHPAMRSLNVGAYAAFPLHTSAGDLGGVLAVLDHEPRHWTRWDREVLGDVASVATMQMGECLPPKYPGHRSQGVIEQFRLLVENSLAGIYIIQHDRIVYANPKLGEIFGYTPEEIISSRSPTDLVDEPDRPRVSENLQKRLRGEVDSVHYTFRGLRRDGRRIEVEALGSRSEIGGEPAVVGMLLDVTERKKMADALRRREARFRSLLENAWDVIHEVGGDGRIRYVSPSVERVLDYRPEELVGRSAADFVHPDDLPELTRLFDDRITRPGSSHAGEIRLRHRDGSWRTAEMQARIVEVGSEPVVIVNTHDVTESRRVEIALRESEQRYRLVARAINSVIREWNVGTGECVWMGASSLLRYTPEELGSSLEWWYEKIHPEDREHVVNSLQAAIDGVSDSWSEEYRLLRGDGEHSWVLDCCFISRDERGTPIRVLGSVMDVTERKQAEEAQRLLASASAVLSQDLDLDSTLGRFARLCVPSVADYCLVDLIHGDSLVRVGLAHVDPAKERLLKKQESHPLHGDPEHHPVLRAVHSQEPVLVTESSSSLLESISHDQEHLDTLREMDLTSFMIIPLLARDTTLGAITLASGESGRRFGPRDLLLAQDLASRAAVAIQQARLYEQAQDAIRAREEILGIVSHDLRNPLNTILMSTSLMLEAAEERRSDNVQSLERISRASTRMADLIGDLLDMSTIDAGQFNVNRSRCRIGELIDEADDMLRPLAAEKSIRFDRLVEDEECEMEIDSRQMLRVFSNLVGNALKFSPEGGRITLRASRHDSAVHFAVTDTGPGIPPEQLPHIFERYWQAREGDRRGVGLGLSIAKGIVEAHGGRIWAEREPDGGAVFRFSVPLSSGSDC